MDDFSIFGYSFDVCLANLSIVLKRCEEVNVILSWEKSHFMVQEGTVLGHKVSQKGIEVDKVKVDLISNILVPSSAKRSDLSLVMLVSIGELLRILVKWLGHTLISSLKMILL